LKGDGLEQLKKGKIRIEDKSVPKDLSPTGMLKGSPRLAAEAIGGNTDINQSQGQRLGRTRPSAMASTKIQRVYLTVFRRFNRSDFGIWRGHNWPQE